jgi:hypothetical protein
MKPIHRLPMLSAAALGLMALSLPRPAAAEPWKVSVMPYAWLTDVGVNGTLGEREVIDADIPVGDLIEDLETTVQLQLEARKGRFGLSIDLFDVNLADGVAGIALPGGASLAADTEIGLTIADIAGTYNPGGNGLGLTLVYGARILNNRAAIDATVTPAQGEAMTAGYDIDDTLVDGLVGIRFVRPITKHLAFQSRADVSTGGTDYTWSVNPSLSYGFGESHRFAITAGYRRMTVMFKEENDLQTEMTMSGPLVGLRTGF